VTDDRTHADPLYTGSVSAVFTLSAPGLEYVELVVRAVLAAGIFMSIFMLLNES